MTLNEKWKSQKLPKNAQVGRNLKDISLASKGIANFGSFKPAERGPAANVPAITQQYQFLSSNSPSGDLVIGPAARVYVQATTADQKSRMQSAQNVLGITKKQIAINEKTGSGKSNVVSTQLGYTTD